MGHDDVGEVMGEIGSGPSEKPPSNKSKVEDALLVGVWGQVTDPSKLPLEEKVGVVMSEQP